MAGSNGRRSGGDRVLESRHLMGLFLGVVVLCGVFFTLGYVMGRTQYGGAVHAAGAADVAIPSRPASKSAKAKAAAENSPSSAPNEWDFYAKNANDHLESPSAAPAATSSPAAPAPDSDPAPSSTPATSSKPAPAPAHKAPAPAPKRLGHFAAPRIPRGSIVLQVSALHHENDALAVATALQRKRFPSFVVAPSSDNVYYRVQVGPYRDLRAADNAKRALEHEGFHPIVKR